MFCGRRRHCLRPLAGADTSLRVARCLNAARCRPAAATGSAPSSDCGCCSGVNTRVTASLEGLALQRFSAADSANIVALVTLSLWMLRLHAASRSGGRNNSPSCVASGDMATGAASAAITRSVSRCLRLSCCCSCGCRRPATGRRLRWWRRWRCLVTRLGGHVPAPLRLCRPSQPTTSAALALAVPCCSEGFERQR